MRLQELQQQIIACELCPRLRDHCETVAITKRRAYMDQEYWGKPVPSFGDPQARLLIIGLAPGAHGANRTGRVFTGDRSGDFLYRSLFETGFANQPNSTHAGDGLELKEAWITCPVHCAPPDNRPLPEEFEACRPYLAEEVSLLKAVKVVVVLGQLAFESYMTVRKGRRTGLKFAHGAEFEHLAPVLLCSYHPSQQNTQTGRLTQEMLTDIFRRARGIIG